MLWRQWLAKTLNIASATSFVPLIPIPAPPVLGPLGRALFSALVYILTHQEPANIGYECVPSPCPGIPPVPPPPPVPCNIPGCGGCFAQGTIIATPKGPKPIQEVRPGDDIYAFDLIAKDVVKQKVIETFKSQAREILVLDFGLEEIRCTPLHRFYVGQWSHAKDLSVGSKVLARDGQWKELKAIKQEIRPQPVFNLHVDESHNYFVGQAGLLVHNAKTPSAFGDGEVF